MKSLSIVSRILVVICGLSLIAVLFLPMWRIELAAPQYPEGLQLNIHANGIRGNVDIINGLNHYIGMKTLHNEDFIEFTVLPYIIGFFVLLFIFVALINKKRLLYLSFGLFVLFGIVAMVDFWKWEYNYGHNLNPEAAIVVPGMAYQPPLIGFKQLLNFGAYSIPDLGGWIFIACGGILLCCTILELRKTISVKRGFLNINIIFMGFSALLLGSCSRQVEPIKIGVDNCAFCKMTISDSRFGGEIVTTKGKLYKFDDINCLNQFQQSMSLAEKNKINYYLVDYSGNHALISASTSFILQSNELKCPMNGHQAAFENIDSLMAVEKIYTGERIKWSVK